MGASSSGKAQNHPQKMSDICLVCNLKDLFYKYMEQPEVVVDIEETVLEPREVRQALEKMS